MTLRYLIQNRKKEKFISRIWIKLWLKRVYRLPLLLKIIWQYQKLKFYGVNLGTLSIINANFDLLRARRLTIGNNCFISPSVMIALHEKVTIGDYVVINSGAKLLTGSHDISDPRWPLKSRAITIEDYVWLAMDAIVLPGVHIGRGAVIGAGAVVRDNVPNYGIMIGNPAVLVGYRKIQDFEYNPTEFVSAYEAWLGSVEKI